MNFNLTTIIAAIVIFYVGAKYGNTLLAKVGL
jgi:hypothetical protein